MKNIRVFYLKKKNHFLEVKFSIYLNMRVFVMLFPRYMYKGNEWISVSHSCLISEMTWNKLSQVRESIKACPHYENIPIQIY